MISVSNRFVYNIRVGLPKFWMLFYVVLFFIFLLGPIFIVVSISFTETEFVAFPPKGFSWRWYERFFEYEPF